MLIGSDALPQQSVHDLVKRETMMEETTEQRPVLDTQAGDIALHQVAQDMRQGFPFTAKAVGIRVTWSSSNIFPALPYKPSRNVN